MIDIGKSQLDEVTQKVTRRLIDEGKLIEAGFVAFRFLMIPKDASAAQVEAMRDAFFAGAQHLFGSIMTALEAGAEPTDNDLRRMDSLHKELEIFVGGLRGRITPKGSG